MELKKQEVAAINQDDILLCPLCGGENLHQQATIVQDRLHGEDGAGVDTTVKSAYNIDLQLVQSENMIGRRHSVRINFFCERCFEDINMSLLIQQYKGSTIIRWVEK